MNGEMEALEKNKTWELVDLLAGKRPMGCKWVYTVKYEADETLERYKTRLVAKRYTQTCGMDYLVTFAPVANMNIVRVLLSFLNEHLEEKIYMEVLPGFGSDLAIKKVILGCFRVLPSSNSLALKMKPRTNGVPRAQKSRNFQGEGPNWVLLAGGALLSTLSIRLGYKLKQALDTKQQENASSGKSADRNKSGACRLHSNAYSFTREDNSCFHCVSGMGHFPPQLIFHFTL
ncbi:Retrovirus-related Pol polyprotein from transposon TNT 1-94 [Vitis vinifera]|uniref:Retrovirus-related Pol polyprotein from transposon TNT 1-94 n=1 Tax=Vitis vinifera TaxID=29760 RepID=A0A438H1Y4_VITVI|nr:Retrovirus-related Pol polyprotein from transposon TNT 1-94 [Vitis vinifera]